MINDINQWCPTTFFMSPLLSAFERYVAYLSLDVNFLSCCLSPQLILLSPHVANGDKVGQQTNFNNTKYKQIIYGCKYKQLKQTTSLFTQ